MEPTSFRRRKMPTGRSQNMVDNEELQDKIKMPGSRTNILEALSDIDFDWDSGRTKNPGLNVCYYEIL